MPISFNPYQSFSAMPYSGVYTAGSAPAAENGQVFGTADGAGRVSGSPAAGSAKENEKAGKTGPQGECQTCKNRKYVDGSNEGNVSFKAPGHIAPEASAGVVMAHEQEHVANAVREGNKAGNELVSVSVSLKTSVCPECGRSYVSGGTTRTTIRYGSTPYEQNRKSADYAKFIGMNMDMKG